MRSKQDSIRCSARSILSGPIIPQVHFRSASFIRKGPTRRSLALLQPSYNWYLNDDWRVLRNLSVSLGVRFEYQTPFKERYNQLSYFDPAATEPVTGLPGVLLRTSAEHRYPSSQNYN